MKVGYARFFLCLFQGDGYRTEQGRMSDYIIEKIQEFVESLLPSMGLELVEIQYRPEGEGWVLRLFLDGPDGIGVDQCAKVSREVSFFLDVEDLVPHAFNLEVSSPGLERPLRNIDDYKRFAGKKARVKLRHPIGDQKVFVGLIGESDENGFELLGEDGTSARFLMDQIRKARLLL
jgi:ribosome maturation factor RimP